MLALSLLVVFFVVSLVNKLFLIVGHNEYNENLVLAVNFSGGRLGG